MSHEKAASPLRALTAFSELNLAYRQDVALSRLGVLDVRVAAFLYLLGHFLIRFLGQLFHSLAERLLRVLLRLSRRREVRGRGPAAVVAVVPRDTQERGPLRKTSNTGASAAPPSGLSRAQSS